MNDPSRTVASRRPNVILIMADQLRADALSCMGNPIVRTPHIDRIAGRGVTFRQAFTNSPVCMASRAAIHTGRYPRSLRIRSMGILPPDEVTLAETFKRNGYRTGLFGKLHFTPIVYTLENLGCEYELDGVTAFLGPAGVESAATLAAASDPFKKNYGFDVSVPVADLTWGHYLDWLAKVSPEHIKHHVAENWGKSRDGVWFGASPPASRVFHPMVHDFFDSRIPAERHPSSFIVDKTVEFIRENASRPFFAHVSFVDPHHPFNAPQPYNRMYNPADMPVPPRYDLERCFPQGLPADVAKIIQKRQAHPDELFQWALSNYYGMISNLDAAVGRLLDEVERLGLAQDTILVFTSDHGEYVGDHRLLYKGSLMFEGLWRIPLFFAWPGNLPVGAIAAGMVQEIDIYPTLMSLTGLSIHKGIQGRDLVPLLRGQCSEGCEFVTCELDDMADRQYAALQAIRTQNWKLTYYPGTRTGMLFDLQDDPGELCNLFFESSAQNVRDEMLMRLLDHLQATKDPLPLRLSQA